MCRRVTRISFVDNVLTISSLDRIANNQNRPALRFRLTMATEGVQHFKWVSFLDSCGPNSLRKKIIKFGCKIQKWNIGLALGVNEKPAEPSGEQEEKRLRRFERQ